MNNENRDPLKKRFDQNVEANLAFTLKELAEERELMKTKWFAYRFMSPESATTMFAVLYAKHLQRSVQSNRDRNMKANGINWVDFTRRGPEFIRCARARKRADQFCIPYGEYLSFSFEFASRRKRRFEPQINQLQGGENSSDLWLMLFEKRVHERLWPSLTKLDMPQYHVDHFKDLAPQRDYREFVIATVSDAGLVTEPWKRIIERYSYARHEIPTEMFQNHVKDHVYNDCIGDLAYEVAQGRLIAAPAAPLAKHELLSGCFGVPGCRDTTTKMCAKCPLTTACQKLNDRVQRKVNTMTGSADPVRQAKRANQNARKARSRANQKISLAGGSI
jgi:hypothetical protein